MLKLFKHLPTYILFFIVYGIHAQSYYPINVKFFNKTDLWVIGADGLILKSSDMGNTWNKKVVNTTNLFYSILRTGTHSLFITGENGILLKSSNDGNNWSISFAPSYDHLKSAAVIDSNTFVICGENGIIYRTVNGGEHWDRINSNTTETLNRIININRIYLVIAGNRGTILFSSDAGITWLSTETKTARNINSVSGNNSGYCVAVGENSLVMSSKNFGMSWVEMNSPYLTNDLLDVKLLQSGNIVAAGTSGTMLRSTNGGFSCQVIYLNVSLDIFTLDFIGSYGIAPCMMSDAIFTTDEGITWKSFKKGNPDKSNASVNLVQTKKFNLKQNYPNPFNPGTKITYELPESKQVVLKVYDVTGREMEILIDRYQEPGFYEVYWDGSKYPGGLYFYKIQAGDFTETKKMILIK